MADGTIGAASRRIAENRQLTGLRGVAAVDVMVSHYNRSDLSILRFFAVQSAAVDLFFCLSAFTLCLVYGAGTGGRLDPRGFAVARFARIYPLYIVSLALAALPLAWTSGWFASYDGTRLSADLLRQVVMVNAWPLIGNGVHWDVPAWSVSVEVFCYLVLFPVLFVASCFALRLSTGMRLALAVTLAFVSFVTWQTGFDPRIATWSNPPAASAWAYWAPVIRGVTMFSAGWLVYLSYLKRDALAALAIVATDAIAVLFLLILLAASLGMTTRHVTLLLFPFLILGLTDGGSITARLLASRPVHFLGLISYSIYLLHFPISDILILRFPVLDAVDGLRLCLTIAVTLVVSTLSYYLIEAPARRLLRRTLGLRSAARSHSPTTASPITSRPGRPSTRSKITRRSWTSATDGR